MSFLDQFSKKASETTSKAFQKAKGLTDIAKINSLMSDEDNKLNSYYNQIGRLYVSLHKEDFEKDFESLITNVNEANSRIEIYKKQIQDIKGIVPCEKCGADIPSGAAFCSACGAPAPKIEDDGEFVKCEHCFAMVKKEMNFCTACGEPMTNKTQEDVKVCPSCGEKVSLDMVFCTKCGTKLN